MLLRKEDLPTNIQSLALEACAATKVAGMPKVKVEIPEELLNKRIAALSDGEGLKHIITQSIPYALQ